MSYPLSLSPVSHQFSDNPYRHSNILGSDAPLGTSLPHHTQHSQLQHQHQHHHRHGYHYAPKSPSSQPLINASSKAEQLNKENIHLSRSTQSTTNLPTESPKTPDIRKIKSQNLLKTDRVSSKSEVPYIDDEVFENVSLGSDTSDVKFFEGASTVAQLESTPIQKSRFPNIFSKSNHTESSSTSVRRKSPSLDSKSIPEPFPFKRWLYTLRKHKHNPSRKAIYIPSADAQIRDSMSIDDRRSKRSRNDSSFQSQSSSSNNFITAIQSASITLAETSIAPRSWLAGRLDQLRRSGLRGSVDSSTSIVEPMMDEMAWMRAVKRRKILEELVETEESYLADLKILANVYVTLLSSVEAISSNIRNSIRENLSQITQLHEELLGALHDTIPHSEYNQSHAKEAPINLTKGHVRWRSADGALRPGSSKEQRSCRKLRHSFDISMPVKECPIALVADPQTAAAVAKVFDRFMGRFFAYEEYGAKYEMMVKDLASSFKSATAKQAYEKGIEVLSRALSSIREREDNSAKGLTFGDLVIKPIQRVCKYPLLFGDLFKHTTIGDDPESHAEIEKVLFRLRETTREINKAADDPEARKLIERTWMLQDKLRFNSDSPRALLTRIISHVNLCGVLHVAYQTCNGVKGQYMLCALFRTCLVLAVGDKSLSKFDVIATIATVSIHLEEPDNGKGLQCHSTPFTWKIVFESEHRLFEILMTACSQEENDQWKRSLSHKNSTGVSDCGNDINGAQDVLSSIPLDIKSIGNLFGQTRSLTRRYSIHRAATFGPKSQLSHVCIKNTCSGDQLPLGVTENSAGIGRSQSLLSSTLVPVLSPRRSERIQMEAALSGIWTKDHLPFPGMKPLKGDNPFRASAHSVMRKLSMASLSSTFSRRSYSATEKRPASTPIPCVPSSADSRALISAAPELNVNLPKVRFKKPSSSAMLNVSRPSVGDGLSESSSLVASNVNFNDTPEMFLPPDFELPGAQRHRAPKVPKVVRICPIGEERCSSAVPPASPRVAAPKLRRTTSMQADVHGQPFKAAAEAAAKTHSERDYDPLKSAQRFPGFSYQDRKKPSSGSLRREARAHEVSFNPVASLLAASAARDLEESIQKRPSASVYACKENKRRNTGDQDRSCLGREEGSAVVSKPLSEKIRRLFW